MLQHFETAPRKTISAMDENRILAEIESFLGENLANNVQNGGAAALPEADRRRSRSLSLYVVCGLVVVVALLPASLRKVDGGSKAAHQAMRDGARGSLSD